MKSCDRSDLCLLMSMQRLCRASRPASADRRQVGIAYRPPGAGTCWALRFAGSEAVGDSGGSACL